jgi:hypothetical protein
MDKAKYEKPLLVELGFDSEVMGVRCKNGTGEISQCKDGSLAFGNCQSGSGIAGGTYCNIGTAAAS